MIHSRFRKAKYKYYIAYMHENGCSWLILNTSYNIDTFEGFQHILAELEKEKQSSVVILNWKRLKRDEYNKLGVV